MATPDYPVFNGDGGANPPKRPVASTDLGGLYKVDELGWEPDPDKRVTAKDVLQWEYCIERMARMLPVLHADFLVSTSTVATLNVVSVNDALNTANVVVTHIATGRYLITIPSNSLPVSNAKPMAIMTTGPSATLSSANCTALTARTWEISTVNSVGTYVGDSAEVKLLVY